MEENIISIQGLGKVFHTGSGDFTALEDIHLEIKKGQIQGIIGLSGAGKSTLVRCINYLERPSSGQIFFRGKFEYHEGERDSCHASKHGHDFSAI